MLGLLTSISSCVVSLVFPVIASYKALAGNDLSLIRPWLMYWIVLGMGLSAESLFQPLLALIPLYGMVRYLTLLWLVLPQTQGAVFLYTVYLEPWLVENDGMLDALAVNSYVRVRNLVVRYMNRMFGTSIPETALSGQGEAASKDQVGSLTRALYSRFRLPVPAEYSLSALVSNWKTPHKAHKEYEENYSKLLEIVASLEKLKDEGLDSDGYDVIDPPPVATGSASPKPETKRRSWW